MSNTDNVLSALEAMLFAAGDPVEPSKLAEVLEIDIETVTKMLGHLSAMYDERESGLMLIKVDNKYQLCTREEHSESVRKLLEIKRTAATITIFVNFIKSSKIKYILYISTYNLKL